MHGARTVCCSASSPQSSRVAQRCFAGSWNHPSTAFDRNQSRGTQLDLRVKRSVQSKSMLIDYVKLPPSVRECCAIHWHPIQGVFPHTQRSWDTLRIQNEVLTVDD